MDASTIPNGTIYFVGPLHAFRLATTPKQPPFRAYNVTVGALQPCHCVLLAAYKVHVQLCDVTIQIWNLVKMQLSPLNYESSHVRLPSTNFWGLDESSSTCAKSCQPCLLAWLTVVSLPMSVFHPRKLASSNTGTVIDLLYLYVTQGQLVQGLLEITRDYQRQMLATDHSMELTNILSTYDLEDFILLYAVTNCDSCKHHKL